jgi:hypothetical protein
VRARAIRGCTVQRNGAGARLPAAVEGAYDRTLTMLQMLQLRQPSSVVTRAATKAGTKVPTRRSALGLATLVAIAGPASSTAAATAGTVTGRIELPAPEKREASSTRGYLDPIDNAILPVQLFNPTPFMLVVLEAQQPIDVEAPPQASYELRGESFSKPVIGVVKGQEVVIRNSSLGPRSLVVQEDPTLIPKGTLNVTGTKSFRIAEAGKIYTIVDPSIPYLRGCIVSVSSPYHATAASPSTTCRPAATRCASFTAIIG